MSVVHNEVRYMVQDPLHPTKSVQTQQGELAFGTTETMVVRDPATAAEIKEKNPWYLVSPFENPAFRPAAAKSRVTFIMPELPWETEWDRKHKA